MTEESTKKFLNAIIGLAILGVGGWGIYWIVRKLIETLWSAITVIPSVNPSLAAALVTGGVAIIVAILANVISNVYAIRMKNQEYRQQIVKEHRENTIPQYKQFIDFTYTLAQNIRDEKQQLTEDEIKEVIDQFVPKLIIWGSDEVIKAFYEYRQASISGKPGENLVFLEDFIVAMRKDLGHANKKIKRGMILGLFVNDIQKFLQEHDFDKPKGRT